METSAMSLESSNTYCIETILAFLSECDVWKFNEAFPEHQETVNSYWTSRRVLNIDNIPSRDAEILPKVIERCINLKELKCTRRRNDTIFKLVLTSIGRHCPMLEVLDISGLKYSDEDLQSLTYFINLKSLNLRYDYSTRQGISILFQNNSQLEDVCIHSNYLEDAVFQNLPKTVKRLEINRRSRPEHEPRTLFDIISNFQLEKFHITNPILSNRDVHSLSKQSTLKTLNINFNADDEVLAALFTNNPDLNNVSLCPRLTMDEATFTKLPKSIKHFELNLFYFSNFDFSILLESLKTWNLESLSLLSDNMMNFFPDLVRVVPNLKHLNLFNTEITSEELIYVQFLKQLKTLRLTHLRNDCNAALRKIAESCINLEVLELALMRFDLSQELYASIARLPKLKKIAILNGDHMNLPNYSNFVHDLSRCPSLTTARFKYGITKEDALTLISGCKKLTHLEIHVGPWIDDLVAEIEIELTKQVRRTNVLNVTLKDVRYQSKNIRKTSSHPLLELS